MRSIDLGHADVEWRLQGSWPWTPLGRGPEVIADPAGVTDWIRARVPGGVHGALHRAGLIPDPLVDEQSVLAEWIEHRWWTYRCEVELPAPDGDEQVELACAGLDHEAYVFVDGARVGHHAGCLVPCAFDITPQVRDAGGARAVRLDLVFPGPPDEYGQVGISSRVREQKPRFGYKWDFSTRLVNIGPWRDVSVRYVSGARIGDVRVDTTLADDHTSATVEAQVDVVGDAPCSIETQLFDPDGRPVLPRIDAPRLWWPNGHGEQPLYRLEIRLTSGDRVLDERTVHVGIRSLEWRHTPGSPGDAQPYELVVNGARIPAFGANVTPLDHLYGDVGADHYDELVRARGARHPARRDQRRVAASAGRRGTCCSRASRSSCRPRRPPAPTRPVRPARHRRGTRIRAERPALNPPAPSRP